MDFAGRQPTPLFIPSSSRYCGLWAGRTRVGNFTYSTSAWTTANQALYIPFHIPWRYPVRRLFWVNGSAAGGNWDIGLYHPSGLRLVSSGSTAASGNNVIQYVSVTPVLLEPGGYYLGITHSSNSVNHAFITAVAVATSRVAVGALQQGTALPLPNPAVFAAMSGTVNFPLCGFTRTSSGF